MTLNKFMQINLMMTFLLASAVALAQGNNQADHRAAFEACLSELGIERPEPGTRPTAMDEEVRDQLDQCLKEKGFDPPKFRGPPPGGGPRGSGEKPQGAR